MNIGSKSIAALVSALGIFAKYAKDGLSEEYVLGAEHDIIYCYVEVPMETDDGRLLCSLGWHFDKSAESWAYWT